MFRRHILRKLRVGTLQRLLRTPIALPPDGRKRDTRTGLSADNLHPAGPDVENVELCRSYGLAGSALPPVRAF